MSSKREDQIRETLEGIRKKNGGRLTRQAVVAYARANKTSVVGRMFTWDKDQAAMAHWLDRAQEIITRYVTIVIVEKDVRVKIPYYISDPAAKTNEGGYVCVADKFNRNDAQQIILNELDRCVGSITRARDIAIALEKQHPGLSAQLRRMLLEFVTMKAAIAA